MKTLLLAMVACATLAGCVAYPVYDPAYSVAPPTPGVYTSPPVYTYPYPRAYGYGYPYGYYGAPWYPSLWISGNFRCCSDGHAHRGHHRGRGGFGGHGEHGRRR